MTIRTTAAFAFSVLAGELVVAQSLLAWQPGLPAPGIRQYDEVNVVARWDPDGAGPLTERLVIGGYFEIPAVGARNLAWFDPTTGDWGAFAASPDFVVYSLLTLANGDLAVGGRFTAIGSLPAPSIAILTASGWTTPGAGLGGHANAAVLSLAQRPNGEIVAAGNFPLPGGGSGLARWNGTSWQSFAGADMAAHSVVVRPNGNVIVSGSFPGDVAEWSDTAGWSVYGAVGGNSRRLLLMPNGDVFASGVPFSVQRWNGSAWSVVGTGLETSPAAMVLLPNGDVLGGTVQGISGVHLGGIARWNGTQWTPFAQYVGGIHDMLALPNGELLIAGTPTVPGVPIARGLAWFDGTAWRGAGVGFDDTVTGVHSLPNGDVVAFGDFRIGGTAPMPGFARLVNGNWTPMPLPVAHSRVLCSARGPGGDLWIGTQPSAISYGPTLWRWTGTWWQPFGTAAGPVQSIDVADPLHPIVGTTLLPASGSAIGVWNGNAWVGLGAGLDGPVHALTRAANGDLIAGGEFLDSGATLTSRVARWNGVTWQPLGSGLGGPVRALARLPNGDLVAGGSFTEDGLLTTPMPLVARWNGTAWVAMGAGLDPTPGAAVHALHVLPDGDVLAGGSFTHANGQALRGLARWNGATWSAVAGGVDGTVLSIASLPNGDVVVGGDFAHGGAQPSAHFARLRSTSPATSVPYLPGCALGAGQLVLDVDSLPWLGATARATCFGVPTNSVAVEALGIAAVQVPLVTIHPTAVPGCSLLVQPDVAQVHVPVGGTVGTQLAIPRQSSLLGVLLHQQVLVFELGAGGIVGLAGSNGLRLTIGSL